MVEAKDRVDTDVDSLIRSYLRTEVTEPILKVISSRFAELAEDRLLTVAQAAKILNVSESWLYKYCDRLSYTVRLENNSLRFSSNQIQKEIARQLKMRIGSR